MIEELFLQNPLIEVWPTFDERVLSQIDRSIPGTSTFTSQVLIADTYDNHFRFSTGAIGFIPIETVSNLIRLQIDGRPTGDLQVNGEQNIFYCRAAENGHPGFVLQAQWLLKSFESPEWGKKRCRWLVLGWALSKKGDYPDWGSFRPAGTRCSGEKKLRKLKAVRQMPIPAFLFLILIY